MVLLSGSAAWAQLQPMSVEPAAASPQASQRLAELAERMAGAEGASSPSVAANEVSVSAIESTPLGQSPSSGTSRFSGGGLSGASAESSGEGGATPSWSGGNMLTTLAALGVVIALIFGVRFLLAKATRTPLVASSSAVEVLSRTSVAPRSHVLLLRVGAKVLVVGESSGGLRTLGSVDREEEVASLLQAVETSKPQSIAGGFSALMGKFNRQYDGQDGTDPLTAMPIDRFESGLDVSEAPVDRARHGLSALAGRLRVRGGSAGVSGGEA